MSNTTTIRFQAEETLDAQLFAAELQGRQDEGEAITFTVDALTVTVEAPAEIAWEIEYLGQACALELLA